MKVYDRELLDSLNLPAKEKRKRLVIKKARITVSREEYLALGTALDLASRYLDEIDSGEKRRALRESFGDINCDKELNTVYDLNDKLEKKFEPKI